MAKVRWKGIQFDSIFEKEIWEVVMGDDRWSYHTFTLPYTITYNTIYGNNYRTDHTYRPDFIEKQDGAPTMVWEAKGRFYTKESVNHTLKMSKLIQGGKYKFGMIIQNPDTKVLGRKKMTIPQWCEKHDITYITFNELRSRYER